MERKEFNKQGLRFVFLCTSTIKGRRHFQNQAINLNPAVGRGGVRGFWDAGQGATTRNGATAKGGAVPSAGRCDPAGDAGAMKRGRGIPCATRSPLREAPHATLRGAPFQGVA